MERLEQNIATDGRRLAEGLLFLVLFCLMVPLADYLTVNISSPNTPGLRALQDKGALEALLDGVAAAQPKGAAKPVFLKVAPDLEPADIDDIVAVAFAKGLAAVIVSNTTIARPALASRHADEAGGLSGAPLADLALQRVRDFRAASGGKLPLIAAGGIGSAEQAWQRIRAGASLIQIYSAMVYEGPGLAARIARGLETLAKRDGFARVSDAVGTAWGGLSAVGSREGGSPSPAGAISNRPEMGPRLRGDTGVMER